MKAHFLVHTKQLIILIGLFFMTSILFCYWVDPFSVYGRYPIREGKEVNAPGFTYQIRMGKAIAINQRQPDVLIMGSSRSHNGFSDTIIDQYFQQSNVYNASYPAINIYEILRYFQHSLAVSPVKEVFIGLDFYQFHGGRPNSVTFSESRLAVNLDNQVSDHHLEDRLATLLSGDAVFYGLKMVTGTANWKDISLANGFRLRDNVGWLKQFMQSDRDYIDHVYTIPKFTFRVVNTDKKSSLDFFRKIVQIAHQKKVALHFFISPSHARQWEIIAQLGLWDTWEFWKQEMLRITVQEGQLAQQVAFLIHDFSGYSEYSTESVPRKKGGAVSKWYADSSHYRHALGDVVMQEMLTGTGTKNFGRILTTDNINTHLDMIKAGQEQYVLTHSQDVTDINMLVGMRSMY